MERRRPLGDSGIHQKPPISYPHFRENSFDHGSRSISPSPPEPPALLMRPSPSFTPVPSSVLNDYQMPLKKVEPHGLEQSQILMDLVQRVKQLENKAEENRKMRFNLEMLEGKTGKIMQRVDAIENAKKAVKSDKENMKGVANGQEQ